MAAQAPPKPPAVEARLADLCKVRSLIPSVAAFRCSGVLRFGWACVQELRASEVVAGEAAALLEEGKGALLALPSFASKSVRTAVFCDGSLRFVLSHVLIEEGAYVAGGCRQAVPGVRAVLCGEAKGAQGGLWGQAMRYLEGLQA